MIAMLVPQTALSDLNERPLRDDDREPLARLMLAAYRGTTDDEGETLDDARVEVDGFYSGKSGAPMADASVVVERDGDLVAATLVTRYENAPFIAYTITHPQWKRHGLGRACIRQCMSTLLDLGHDRLRLVVTPGNTPAERLFEQLGFVDE